MPPLRSSAGPRKFISTVRLGWLCMVIGNPKVMYFLKDMPLDIRLAPSGHNRQILLKGGASEN